MPLDDSLEQTKYLKYPTKPEVLCVLYALYSRLFVIQSMLGSVNKQFRGSAFEVIELWLRKCRADLYAQHPLSDTRLEVVRALAQEVKGVTERLVTQLPHPFFTYSRPTHIEHI